MDKIVLSRKNVEYLEKIYGGWWNLIAAGTLFICYALVAVWTMLRPMRAFRAFGLLYWFPGAILLIMGCFFTANALWMRFKDEKKNDVLLARGIFDILAGLFILFIPWLGTMLTMFVMGLVLLYLGVRKLINTDNNVWQFILAIVFITVGVSNVDVTGYILPQFLRMSIFCLFMGGLGIFLLLISKPYLAEEDKEKEISKEAESEKDVQETTTPEEPAEPEQEKDIELNLEKSDEPEEEGKLSDIEEALIAEEILQEGLPQETDQPEEVVVQTEEINNVEE